MTAKRTLVSFDWAMKSILKKPENFEVLEGFLAALLNDENIKIMEILESESTPRDKDDKFNRVDLKAKDSNGKIIMIPYNSSHIGVYDPATNTYTDGPLHNRGTAAFEKGILIYDGKIILIPKNSSHIGVYDPEKNTYTDGPAHGRGTSAFSGGVLVRKRKIILIPEKSTNIGILTF